MIVFSGFPGILNIPEDFGDSSSSSGFFSEFILGFLRKVLLILFEISPRRSYRIFFSGIPCRVLPEIHFGIFPGNLSKASSR